MNIQEFATLAELDLPVKILLFDNASLGMVRQQQQLFYERRFFAAQFDHPTDFVAIARSFGVESMELNTQDDFAPQLAALLQSKKPAMIRVPIGHHYNVTPMVGPGAANIDAMDCDY